MACLVESRAGYSEMLAALKAQYEAEGTGPTQYDLTALHDADVQQVWRARPEVSLGAYL